MPGHHAEAGFTLIELIMVMVIIGALATFALPRLVDTTAWRLRAFSDQLLSRLQTAQRLALTQRRPVIATITASGASFDYVSGGNIATLACPSSISSCIAGSGTRSVTFNSGNSGQAVTSSGAALTVTVSSGDTTRTVTIENDTGLVH